MVSAQASDRDVDSFTLVLGVYAVVSLGKVLYANFPGSVVTGEQLCQIEVRLVKQSGHLGNAGISESSSG